MLGYLLDKAKHVIVTLRASILSIFVTLFVVSMITVITVTYFRFSTSIAAVSFRVMQQVSRTVFTEIENEIHDVTIEGQFAAYLMQQNIFNVTNQPDLVAYTYGLMKIQSTTLPSVQSAFWGDEEGNFVLASKLDDQSVFSELVNTKQIPAFRQVIFRDPEGKITKYGKPVDMTYDPRERLWYQTAKKAGKLIWTDVYRYRQSSLLGISTAIPVYKKNGDLQGVFAMNVRLDFLRHFIETMRISKHGLVYIVTGQGKVIAFPDMPQHEDWSLINVKDLNYPWLTQSFNEYQATKKNEFGFKYKGEKYLAIYRAIPAFAPDGWYIGVVAPAEDFTQELIRTNILIIFISLIILALGIFIMSNLVNHIVRPLKKLVSETEKIKRFELDDTKHIHSRIEEVMLLSNAIYAMKNGLRQFKRYVPESLVHHSIEASENVLIGGDKKTLAIFFSDIQDFTAVAEQMDPNQLMEYMCEYFNELSHIISDTEGTIDKYIGDSVMAFWGAPLPIDNVCQRAAHAALLCVKRLAVLNEKWVAEGKPPLNTRIGLNYGEVIVGNLGSDERLNYTAIGDAINMTNRLENINKIYGTKIIVSDSMNQVIKKKFVLRLVDCVAVKGKLQANDIYELLAEDRNELSFDLEKYKVSFKQGFLAYQKGKWDDAIRYFHACMNIYAQDTLAPVFIRRCEQFKLNPPDSGWKGVWRMQEK